MDIIKNALASGKNVVVVGDVGLCRTTDVETVKTFSPSDRIVSVEDCREFKIADAEAASILVDQK